MGGKICSGGRRCGQEVQRAGVRKRSQVDGRGDGVAVFPFWWSRLEATTVQAKQEMLEEVNFFSVKFSKSSGFAAVFHSGATK